jgi:polyphosphate kinase 2
MTEQEKGTKQEESESEVVGQVTSDTETEPQEEVQFETTNYPYSDKIPKKIYEKRLEELQIELQKLQKWVIETNQKIIILFEGRDAAGKGGTIKRFREHMNPRHTKIVALDKPTEREQTEWYFKRYVAHLPAAGEIVLFDRSWYNRAGVERVMKWCEPEEFMEFIRACPNFEQMQVDSGTRLYKYWFSVDQEEQKKRFDARMQTPLKMWKMSPVDKASRTKWKSYTKAKDEMFFYTDRPGAHWTVVKSQDKRRARLAILEDFLCSMEYSGKNHELLGTPDAKIVGPCKVMSNKNEVDLLSELHEK